MSELIRIGQLAARSGRSIHAIRWYETQGLIPGVTRDSSGRRVYNELHLGWLDLIDRLRRTGMSVAEMRRYTSLSRQGRATLAQRHALLAAHRDRVGQMIEEWTVALKLIDAKVDYYGEWISSGQRPQVYPSDRPDAPPRQRGAAPPRAARKAQQRRVGRGMNSP